MMTGVMQIQLVIFIVAVLVCVAWTKLVYLDGLQQKLKRMRRHCMIHAGMISWICVWAIAMGFNLHHKQESVIEKQQETIQQLANGLTDQGDINAGIGQQIANVGNTWSDETHAQAVAIATPGGTVVSFAGGTNRASSGPGVYGTTRDTGRSRQGSGRCGCESEVGSAGTFGMPVPRLDYRSVY